MIEHHDTGADPSSWTDHSGTSAFEAVDASGTDTHGADPSDVDGSAAVDIGGTSLLLPEDGSGSGLSLTDTSGATWEIGEPLLSSVGGAPDSVVTYTGVGAEVFSDLDGDGRVDQIVRIAGNGELILWDVHADGGWQLAGTGEVDATGGVQLWPFAVEGGARPTGFGDVPTGHLAVAGGSGFSDVGAPQYDMNGDGTPETAVVERDGEILQYSDTDGDGRADQLLQIDTDDRSATILLDHGNGWVIEATGHLGDDGDFVPDHGATPVGVPVVDAPPAIEVTVPGSTGAVSVGPPDQDIDGDGVAESVAVRAPDGHLLIVSDTDADGSADQMIDVDQESGRVSWMTLDDHDGGDGGWVVAQHGHVTPEGGLQVDGRGPADGLANPGTVAVSVDGRTFPAGPASIDTDGDGVPDTVAVPGVGGSTQYYQDSDGDGIADRAWTVNADGARGQEYRIDDDGQWVTNMRWTT